ncbi:MAG: hypothetical protein ACI9YR_002870, partial [Bacteroidia bacterium]
SDFGRVSLAVNQITPVVADAARVNAGGL